MVQGEGKGGQQGKSIQYVAIIPHAAKYTWQDLNHAD
jgi:hypothetical protein